MRQIASLVLILPLVASGCAAVLGIGAGVVISQDVLDSSTFVAQLEQDTNVAWATAKASLGHQSTEPIAVDEDLRTAVGTVDGAEVTVSVEAYDLNRCRLLVSARKYAVSNGEIAEMVFNKIINSFNN